MATFDLRAAMRRLMDDTDLKDPSDFAVELFKLIPVNQRAVILRKLLRGFARVQLGLSRSRPKGQESTTVELANAHRAASGRSARVQGYRTIEGPRWLRERTFLGDHWEMVADCTLADVVFLKDEAFRLSSRLHDIGEKRWAALESLMIQYGVVRIRDLPAGVLASFDWEAGA